MPKKINDNCADCGVCAEVCPEEAIVPGDGKHEIIADKCKDCGECVEVCPSGAIEDL
ncbi:MAG: 4Fe-4S binding protein [Fimbriimonadales bacterium]